MTTKTYSEKLKDPRWQRRRLEILSRDQFKCVYCADEKTTLNVHHDSYNGEPWEADDSELKTVCEHCHKVIHVLEKHKLLNSRKILSIERTENGESFQIYFLGEMIFIPNINSGSAWRFNQESMDDILSKISSPQNG